MSSASAASASAQAPVTFAQELLEQHNNTHKKREVERRAVQLELSHLQRQIDEQKRKLDSFRLESSTFGSKHTQAREFLSFVQSTSPFVGGWLQQLFRNRDDLPQALAQVKVAESNVAENEYERRFRLTNENCDRHVNSAHYVPPTLFSDPKQPCRMTAADRNASERNTIDFSVDDGMTSNRTGCISLSFPTDAAICNWLVSSDKERAKANNFHLRTLYLRSFERVDYNHTSKVQVECKTGQPGNVFVSFPPTLQQVEAQEFQLSINDITVSIPLIRTAEPEAVSSDDGVGDTKHPKKRGHAESANTAAKRAKAAAITDKIEDERSARMYETKDGPFDLNLQRLYHDREWKTWDEITPDQVDPNRRALVDALLTKMQARSFFSLFGSADQRNRAWIPDAPLSEHKDSNGMTGGDWHNRALDVLCRRGKHTITEAVFHGLVSKQAWHPMFVVLMDVVFARLDEDIARWKDRRVVAANHAATACDPAPLGVPAAAASSSAAAVLEASAVTK